MRTVLLLIICSLIVLQTKAQHSPSSDIKTCLYGYRDYAGKWIIEPIFDTAEKFINDKAIVSLGNKFGIIDKKGKFILEPTYEFIEYPYSNIYPSSYCTSFYIVKQNNKHGILYANNCSVITKPKYNEIKPLDHCTMFIYKLGDKWGIIDNKDQIITGAIFPTSDIQPLNKEDNDTIFVYSKKRFRGLYDANKKQLIHPPIYNYFAPLGKSMYAISQGSKIGIIDKKGKLIHPIELDSIWEVPSKYFKASRKRVMRHPIKYNHLMLAVKDHKYALINTAGNIVLNTWFEHAPYQINDNYIRIQKEQHYGLLYPNGNTCLATEFDKIEITSEFILARQNGMWGIHNIMGEVIEEPIFKSIDYSASLDTLAVVNKQGKLRSYIISSKQEQSFIPPLIAGTISRQTNYIKLQVNNLFGLYDTLGTELLPPIYKHLPHNFEKYNEIIVQDSSGSCALMSQQFELISAFEYDSIIRMPAPDSSTVFWIINQGNWGAMLGDGTITIPCIFDIPYIESHWKVAKADCKLEFWNPILMRISGENYQLYDVYKGLCSPPGSRIISETNIINKASYLINTEDDYYTFVNQLGEQIFPAISLSPPTLAGNNSLFISNSNGYGTCDFSGKIQKPFGSLSTDDLEQLLLYKITKDEYYIRFDEQTTLSGMELSKFASLLYENLELKNDADYFGLMNQLYPNEEKPQYKEIEYCYNNPCLRLIDNSSDNKEWCEWPPWYHTAENLTHFIKSISDNYYEVKSHNKVWGNTNRDYYFFKYYKLTNDTLIQLEREDLFTNTSELWTELSKQAIQIITDNNLDVGFDCTRNQQIITEHSNLSFDSNGISIWLSDHERWETMRPVLTIPFDSITEFINKDGLLWHFIDD